MVVKESVNQKKRELVHVSFFCFQDVQWNDIDYAIGMKDFTTDLKRFGDQAAMVDELHNRGMHYVIITVWNV